MIDTLSLMLGVSLFLGALGLVAFIWALKSGQFEDADKATQGLLFDGEEELNAAIEKEKRQKAFSDKEKRDPKK